MNKVIRAITVIGIMLLAGCSAIAPQDPTLSLNEQQIYELAKTSLNKGNLMESRELYEKLGARYPFGRYAEQAMLDKILMEYKDGEFDAAVARAEQYIKQFPRSEYVDYAKYMKGVVQYSRDIKLFDKIFPAKLAKSDQTFSKEAYRAFQQLVKADAERRAKTPEEAKRISEYAEDAKKRMIYLRNQMAAHEVYVGEYYLRRGAFLAAANRGKYVLENFSESPSTAMALAIMTRAYKELGETQLAADSERVLMTNFAAKLESDKKLNRILTGNVRGYESFWSRLTGI